MSNDDEPEAEMEPEGPEKPSSWEPVDGGGGELEEKAQRLEEKEERLDQRERDLNKRERDLEKREQEVLERREENVDTRERLEEREQTLDERESALDDREQALEERERDLSRRADEIETKEEALSEHVRDELEAFEGSLVDKIEERTITAVQQHGGNASGRFGTIGGVLLGLVGLVLVAGGLSNGLLAYVNATYGAGVDPLLLETSLANYAASAVLVFLGLAANLAAAAGRA